MILLPLSRQPQSVAIALMPRQGLTTAHWQAGGQHVFSSTSSSRYLYLCSTSPEICFPGLPSYDTWVIWYPMQTIISRPRLGLELGQTRCSVSLEWRQQKYRAFPTMDGRRRSLVSVRIGSARYRSREKKSSVEIQTIPTAWQRGNTTGIKELSLCLTALVFRRQDSGGAYRLLYDGGNPFSILRHQISSRRVCKALRQP